MSGELKLINIMLIIVLGVWIGAAINSVTVRTGSTEFRLPSSSQAAPAQGAVAVTDGPKTVPAPSYAHAADATCPAGEIAVFIASGLDGTTPVIPEGAASYCVVAGPLPGGLTAAAGACYSLNGSLVCNEVLDGSGGRWSCPAVAGAVPAWQDASPRWPRCVPKVSAP